MNKPILYIIREKKVFKFLSALVGLNFVVSLFLTSSAFALTSGPSQPEFQSFEPIGTTDMVDIFTGDFTYNIPLFELPGPNGGYPFNMAYHSGIGMDQEASWVGLGWNLNPGVINREVRGLPDDFKGDLLSRTVNRKANHTFGVGLGGSLEVFGAGTDKGVELGLGIKIYYNNYKGMGYSFDPSFGFGDEPSLGIGFSLDSQEGVGGSASLSTSKEMDNGLIKKHSLGIGFNSKRGLNLSLSRSVGNENNISKTLGKNKAFESGATAVGGSSSFSFSEFAYTPTTSLEMRTKFLSVGFKTGTGLAGLFGNMYYNGFYNVEYLKNAEERIDIEGYGYHYLEESNKEDLLDFNRSKDAVVRKTSSNLGIPSLTYDYYSILGQGTGGMFRPYRTDIGAIHDPYVVSKTVGSSIGFDIGPSATPHFGIQASFSQGSTKSGPWDNDDSHNEWADYYKFFGFPGATESPSPDYETVYYKVRGEYTSFGSDEMDFIGGEVPVRADLPLEGFKKFNPTAGKFHDKRGNSITAGVAKRRPLSRERMPRNMSVQPITNSELGFNFVELGEYDIEHFSASQINSYNQSMSGSIQRGAVVGDHIGGYTVINNEGQRYVYGLPAYNKKKVERLFAVGPESADYCGPTVPITMSGAEADYKLDNTDHFFSKTETPQYAHAYLLSSILGADYVDIDATPGPSDGDLGYWVKFNYVETASNFKWRAPFTDANYAEGLEPTAEDNRATFVYGEKEIFHVASVETKTHIAIFEISPRQDAFGPNAEYNHSNGTIIDNTKPSYQLDLIKLFAKADYQNSPSTAIPLKRVHFVYSYDLCPNVQNNQNYVSGQNPPPANSGKLTLTKVFFKHGNSDRGELSPYEFDYHEGNRLENPDYCTYKYDRWGNYKPLDPLSSTSYECKDISTVDECINLEFPYVRQFDRNANQSVSEKQQFKDRRDLNSAVWSLKQITLPTGGVITVDYESDDYAYVQHRAATQMFKIAAFGKRVTSCTDINTTVNGNNIFHRRVYFDLENPILSTGTYPSSTVIESDVFNPYLRPLVHKGSAGVPQLYYKIKIELRDGLYDYVSGYADLETDHNLSTAYPSEDGVYGVDPNCIKSLDLDGNGAQNYYTRGFVTLKKLDINGPVEYHPFSVAAWQHMRTNQPDLMTSPGTFDEEAGSSKQSKALKVKSLLSVFPAIGKMFKGFRKHAHNKGWGQLLDLDNCWIKLGTPDKVKYGGGTRVSKIAFSDSWNLMSGEADEEYGQIYDYTITENGKSITSGVAQYEPILGGDENALRYAKKFNQHIPIKTDNDLFFEFPINEAYFPGPMVGYSKITVMSLATNDAINASPASGIRTTGVTEHEFYTAKEFPVITDQTDIRKRPFFLYIPIPFIGQIQTKNMTASQGYSIQLNDMHGKLKSVKSFALDADGVRIQDAVNSVEYIYHTKAKNYDDKAVRELDNLVSVIIDDFDPTSGAGGNFTSTIESRLMGVEYEFFTDQRKNRSRITTGGLDFNVEVILGVPIPAPWPEFSNFKSDVRTVTTNKIIHKAGILKSVIAKDGLSTVVTENKLFDAISGRPLLTTITNNFDNPVYNYQIPGHWEYPEMGRAADNYGFLFRGLIETVNADNQFTMKEVTLKNAQNGLVLLDDLYDILSEGDEFIISSSDKATLIKKRLIISGGIQKQLLFHTDRIIAVNQTLDFHLVRSGNRNHLTLTIGNITSLDNPTVKGVESQGSLGVGRIPGELDDFLNSIIDCNGDLTSGQYDFSSEEFIGEDGNYKFPTMRQMFDVFKITGCGASNCDPNFSCGGNSGYHIDFKQTGGSSKLCHCLAKKAPIDKFEKIAADQIEVTYLGGTQSNTVFCASHPGCWQNFSFSPDLQYTTNVLQASAMEFRNYWDYDFTSYNCNNPKPVEENLYAVGKKGIWRPWQDYYYNDQRYKDPTGIDLSHDGVFDGSGSDFRFYQFEWDPSFENPRPVEWISSQIVTKYNEQSNEVEQRDILGTYSSALYGFNQSLTTAIGANMRVKEMLFESFDDPSSSFFNTWFTVVSTKAHTGQNSIYGIHTSNQIPLGLNITAGDDYIFSCWVSEDNTSVPDYKTAHTLPVRVKISYFDVDGIEISQSAPFYPSGEVIEGWQKIEETFTPPVGTVDIDVDLVTPSSNTNPPFLLSSYFDDIRILPAQGNMKTFVYDPNNFKVQAELDRNNFATLYHYDEQGNLYLIRQETERGMVTLKEVRSHQAER